ncbi:hypothetical protein GF373_09100 [bacterium]|nr:hypothetical protein [bacterium]
MKESEFVMALRKRMDRETIRKQLEQELSQEEMKALETWGREEAPGGESVERLAIPSIHKKSFWPFAMPWKKAASAAAIFVVGFLAGQWMDGNLVSRTPVPPERSQEVKREGAVGHESQPIKPKATEQGGQTYARDENGRLIIETTLKTGNRMTWIVDGNLNANGLGEEQ